VAVDPHGNVYLTGYTLGSLGGSNQGNADAFLAKYDANGNLQWTRQLGTPSDDYGFGVGPDGQAVYVCGQTSGSLGGPNQGLSDVLLAKYDLDGNPIWQRQQGTANYDGSYDVALDATGVSYLTGFTDSAPVGTDRDALILSFNGHGDLLWTQTLRTLSIEEGFAVALDNSNNLLISGHTSGPLAGTVQGGIDPFIMSFSVPEPANLGMLIASAVCLRRGRR
jgi:hypothetical protein